MSRRHGRRGTQRGTQPSWNDRNARSVAPRSPGGPASRPCMFGGPRGHVKSLMAPAPARRRCRPTTENGVTDTVVRARSGSPDPGTQAPGVQRHDTTRIRPLSLLIDDHRIVTDRVVGSGTAFGPSAGAFRIPEIGHEVQTLGEKPDVHPIVVRVAIGHGASVVHPRRALVLECLAAAKDGQTVAVQIGARVVPVAALVSD